MEFRPIEITDKERAEQYIKLNKPRGCDSSFGDQFIWAPTYNTQIAFDEDFYIVKYKWRNTDCVTMPFGVGNDVKVLDRLKAQNIRIIVGATENYVKKLSDLGVKFYAKPVRDTFDYIYTAEKLALLKGKKLHGKRNHINKFKSLYNYSYRLLEDNIEDAITINKQWCKENGVCEDETVLDEKCAVKLMFNNLKALNVRGIVLYIDNKPVAYTAGAPVYEGSDTFVVNFEKAIGDYQGTYTMINYIFANELLDEFNYINREDDLGIEGLRKAKLSYQPDILLEKYRVVLED